MQGNFDALLYGSFDLGKDGLLSREGIGSLKCGDVMKCSGEDFYSCGCRNIVCLVFWMLRICDIPPAYVVVVAVQATMDISVVVGVFFVFGVTAKSYPNIFSFNCDEFNSCFSGWSWELNVISGVFAKDVFCCPPMLEFSKFLDVGQ